MVERFPRNAAGHRLLGMLRARRGEPGAALPHLERAAILAPDWPDSYLALGNVQQLLRNAPARREKMVTATFARAGPNTAVARIMVASVRRSMLAARVARDRQPAC
jgi:hypothetical protein